MADEKIKKSFIDGVHLVFSTMFNKGTNQDDGVLLYRIYEGSFKKSVYDEQKYKTYLTPVTLISKVSETPNWGEADVEAQKYSAEFTVPVKSLNEHGITMDKDTIDYLKKGMMFFGGRFYEINSIKGTAFVENIYLLWHFYCTEDNTLSEFYIHDESSDGMNPDIKVEDVEVAKK